MSAIGIGRSGAMVGAEVTGVDPQLLAGDDVVAGAVIAALEIYGVLVWRALHLDPET
jgi:hypothetical protein